MRSRYTSNYRYMCHQLRRARLERGWTQRQVADRLGMPHSRVARIESGERRLDVIELDDFATLYRKPLTYFVKRKA